MKLTGRTTLKTLAKASGVSVATASQVIRGVGRISDHTRKRVLSTAEKMNYIPDGRAISMRFRGTSRNRNDYSRACKSL
jgi:DNA-binding LacI/PurR family transcriptional regulator